MGNNDEQEEQEIMTLEYVHRKRYAEELGVTNKVVTNWMQKHWTNGQHYKVIGKQTLINVGEAKKWLREYGTQSQI